MDGTLNPDAPAFKLTSGLNPDAASFEPTSSPNGEASSSKQYFRFNPEAAAFNPVHSKKLGATTFKLDPEASPFKAPVQLNPEAAPFTRPVQLNPEAVPFKLPSKLNPKATPFKLPFQLNPESTPFKTLFKLNPEAAPFKVSFQLNPEAAPFKLPFQLNPEAPPFKIPSKLNPEAAEFLFVGLLPWPMQNEFFQWLQWLQWQWHLGMPHAEWDATLLKSVMQSAFPGAAAQPSPNIVDLSELSTYTEVEDAAVISNANDSDEPAETGPKDIPESQSNLYTIPHSCHPMDAHHVNWLGCAIEAKSFTRPATSLAIIMGPAKLLIMPMDHLDNCDIHQQVVLRRAFCHIDPVVFSGSRETLQLTGTALENAAIGQTEKFYTGWGCWHADHYDEDDDIPRLDPLDAAAYDPKEVIANGIHKDPDVRLPTDWIEAVDKAKKKARDEREGTYKHISDHKIGKSRMRVVWNASDMDDFDDPLYDWADEADELPSPGLESVDDALQQMRKDLNITAPDTAVSSSEELASLTIDEPGSSGPIATVRFPPSVATSDVAVDTTDALNDGNIQESPQFADAGSENSNGSSSPSVSAGAEDVYPTEHTPLTSDEEETVDADKLSTGEVSGEKQRLASSECSDNIHCVEQIHKIAQPVGKSESAIQEANEKGCEDLESRKHLGLVVHGDVEDEADDEPVTPVSLAQFMESEAMSSTKYADLGHQHHINLDLESMKIQDTGLHSMLNRKQSFQHLRDITHITQLKHSSGGGEQSTDLHDIEDALLEEGGVSEAENDVFDDQDNSNAMPQPLRSPFAQPQSPTLTRMLIGDDDVGSDSNALGDSTDEDSSICTSPPARVSESFSYAIRDNEPNPQDANTGTLGHNATERLSNKEFIVTSHSTDKAEDVITDKADTLTASPVALLPGSTPLASEGNKDGNRTASMLWFGEELNGRIFQQNPDMPSVSQRFLPSASLQIIPESQKSKVSASANSLSALPPSSLLNALENPSPALKASAVNETALARDFIVYSTQVPSSPRNMGASPLALSSHTQGMFANFSAWHPPAMAQSNESASATIGHETTSHEYTPTSVHNRFEDVSVGLVSCGTPKIEESFVTEEGQSAEMNTSTPAASRENLGIGMTSGDESRIQTLTPVSTPTPAARLLSAIKTGDEQRNSPRMGINNIANNNTIEAQAVSNDSESMSFREALEITPPRAATRRGRTNTAANNGRNPRRDIDPSPSRARTRRPFIHKFASATSTTRATAGSPAPIGITPTTASGIIQRMRDSGRRRITSASSPSHDVHKSAGWRVRTEILGDGTGEWEQNEERSGLVVKMWRGLKGFFGREMNVLRA